MFRDVDVISTSLGRYRVDGPVGVGPDGPVHRATAERLGATPVALRRTEIADGPARDRLRRDAEIVAALGHPALAVVSDILEVDDRTVLLAGTLGTGGNLDDLLALGPVDVGRAISLLQTLADALRVAHAAGLAHGRITARNVVLTADGGGPVLTDLAQAGAEGRDSTPRDDTRALLHLASRLVDGTDRSPRAAAYRAVCRWSLESEAALDGVLAALDRIDAAASIDEHPAAASIATRRVEPRPGPPATAVAVGLALAAGATLGAVGTLLPAVVG